MVKQGITHIKKPYPVNDINDIQDEEVNKAKEDANKAIDEASSAGTAKAIGDVTAENIKNFDPKATPAEGVKPVDSSKLDEKKQKQLLKSNKLRKIKQMQLTIIKI